MNTTKKSFLIYFDNYPMLAGLPMDQRGMVLTALMEYGDRVWRDDTVIPDEVLDLYPFSPEGRMAAGFMCGNILRDTHRWMDQKNRREQRKQEQQGKPAPTPAQQSDRYQQNVERTRRLLAELRDA